MVTMAVVVRTSSLRLHMEAGMTNSDNTTQLMLDFACSWRRFGGGPDEDIMVRFGLSAPEFFRRVERMVQSGQHRLDAETADELLKVCRRRLWTDRSQQSAARARSLRHSA